MKTILDEQQANAMMAIMVYCYRNGYTQTATVIDRDFDFKHLTRYLKIEGDQNQNTISQVTFKDFKTQL